jgi:hypothetical protein
VKVDAATHGGRAFCRGNFCAQVGRGFGGGARDPAAAALGDDDLVQRGIMRLFRLWERDYCELKGSRLKRMLAFARSVLGANNKVDKKGGHMLVKGGSDGLGGGERQCQKL